MTGTRCVALSACVYLCGVSGAMAADNTAARLKLLESRIKQLEENSAIIEAGAVNVTVAPGKLEAVKQIRFAAPRRGALIILAGETGTAGSWLVTKTQRMDEKGFELAVINAQMKPRDIAYTARIGYVVLRPQILGD